MEIRWTICVEEICCCNGRNAWERINFGFWLAKCWLALLPFDGIAGYLPAQLRHFASQLRHMSDEDINTINPDCCTTFVTSWLNFCTGVLVVFWKSLKPSWLFFLRRLEQDNKWISHFLLLTGWRGSPFWETLFRKPQNCIHIIFFRTRLFLGVWACSRRIAHAQSAFTMMFCTTFLSAPSEELGCEGGGAGGAAGGGGLSPGSCLSSLHCMVLPQDELYPSLSDPTAQLSVCPEERSCNLVGKMLLDVSMTTCRARDGGCIWDRVRRRRSRSASPSPSKTPKSPCSESVKGMRCW